MKKNRVVFVLGDQIRAARYAQRITMASMAAEIGITPAGLRLIEQDKSDPVFSTVVALAARLGLSLDALAARKDCDGPEPLLTLQPGAHIIVRGTQWNDGDYTVVGPGPEGLVVSPLASQQRQDVSPHVIA